MGNQKYRGLKSNPTVSVACHVACHKMYTKILNNANKALKFQLRWQFN